MGQARDSNSNALEYFLSDGHGSTRELLTAGGNPLADATSGLYLHFDYDAFGNAWGFDPSAPTLPTTRLYSPLGGAWDSGLGQYHFNARDYAPTVGRFSSFDSFEGNQLTLQR